jgi:hypothetical protein
MVIVLLVLARAAWATSEAASEGDSRVQESVSGKDAIDVTPKKDTDPKQGKG